MTGDIHMIFDSAAVTKVVSAPDHHIVTDLNSRLDRLVFENKAVVADGEVRPED